MTPRADLPLQIDEHAGPPRVVVVRGELDIATAPVLRERLHDAISAGHANLVVDVAGLGFMDSTGISVLVEAAKQARRHGGGLTLRSPTPNARRVLQITGLLELFGIAPGPTP